MDNEAIEDIIVQRASIVCKSEAEDFRDQLKQSEIYIELIKAGRIDDVTDLFFKKGFPAGMRFNRQILDGLK